MILRIPTATDDRRVYDQRTTLDGREYILRFVYASRTDSWTLHVSDESSVPIALGRRIVPGTDLLGLVTDPRRPPGSIVAVDFSGEGREPGLGELGTSVILYYFDAAERASIAAEADGG
jgi:hypothetical protein